MIIQVRGNKLVVPDGIERIENGSGLIYMGDKEKVEMILLPKSLKPKFRDWNPYADYGERDVEVIQKR